MVKNTAFFLSKQQSLDPRAHFYLGNVGGDPLEILFGCTCMIGGHNSACSYAQAIDCLGAAKDIDGVFKCHPELDPEIWKGDIVTGQCDLPLVWCNGCDSALSILITSQLDLVHYSFNDHFNNPDVDMLRPFGQNKYFSITTEEELEDPSHVPPELPPVMRSPPSQHLETILSNEDGDMIQLDEPDTYEEEDEIMLTFQEVLINKSPADAPSQSSSEPPPADALSLPLPHGPGICPYDYLLYGGRWIHKQTVCWLVINKDFVSKSLNRLEHVREGYMKNLFLVGDIFLTILCSGHNLSIGVLHSTSATLNGISRASINATIMKSLHSTAKITGQLLSVIPTDPSSDAAQMFLWDGGYITAQSVIQGTSDSTACVIIVSVPGALMESVNPEPTFLRLCEGINSDAFSQVNSGQSTWQIPQDALQPACDLIWAKAVEMKLSLKSIASVTPLDMKSFPYQFSNGTVAVFSVEANSLLAASKGKRVVMCLLCKAKALDMRCHMGQHILHALCNTPEVIDMKEQVGETYLCGFCGCSGQSKCTITITVTASSAPTWTTQHTYQHTFKYGAIDNGSKNKPC
ncbi:hypothetical protein DFJ58DRAFT_732048 [Suillus subalutaceus]|uniref:uncharacterized protein n=1 Tax=Suillus subalutaceus TaxID=48586 RepID=UPI001B8629C5|nr:uncharacterized protein DFJ58DRAFT_732048 [Suillus subalutaceus]KAG1842367.1 hypothetical protein DFJ58DRAFT_732048 [Suillus subalutaceus]